jgi:hypothetical protein
MTEDDADNLPDLLRCEVVEELGGPDLARTRLFAEAWREMLQEGPYVREMTYDEQKEMADAFVAEFRAESPENREHMEYVCMQMARDLNKFVGPRGFVGSRVYAQALPGVFLSEEGVDVVEADLVLEAARRARMRSAKARWARKYAARQKYLKGLRDRRRAQARAK